MSVKLKRLSSFLMACMFVINLGLSVVPAGAINLDPADTSDGSTSMVEEAEEESASVDLEPAPEIEIEPDSSEPVSNDSAEENAHAEISASDDADVGEAEMTLEAQHDETTVSAEVEVEAETEDSADNSNLSLMALAECEFGASADPIGYSYGSGITFSTIGGASDYGGMSSKKLSSSTHPDWSNVYYRTFTNTAYSEDVYADYYQNGYYTDSNGRYQTCDTRIYFWIDSASSTGAITYAKRDEEGNITKKAYWGAAYAMTDVANKDRTKPCIIHMQIHFYKGGTLKSGTSKELSAQKGFMYLVDLDKGEGYYLNSGVSKVYLSSNTSISRIETAKAKKVYDEECGEYANVYYHQDTYVSGSGCESSSIFNPEGQADALGVAFSAPLVLTYYAGARYFSTITDTSVKLTYKIVGTIPTGHTPAELTPAVRHFATFTKTAGSPDKAQLFGSESYTPVDGYVFTGWYTNSSLTGSKYTGTDNMSSNVTIYGKYETANLNIDKYLFLGDTADEEAVSLLASNKNANFTFTIAGTTTATQNFLKAHPEKAKVTISGSQFTRSVDSAGKVNIMARATVEELLPGAYTVTETTVNSGESIWYVNTDSASGFNNPQTLTLTTGTNSTKFKNAIRRRTITVNKTFAENYDLSSMTTADKTFTFTLTGTTVLGTPVNQQVEIVGAGKAEFSNIHAGDYTITETASDKWNPVEVKTVIVRDDYVQIDDVVTSNATFTNTMREQTMPLRVKKVDSDKNDLANAKFTVYEKTTLDEFIANTDWSCTAYTTGGQEYYGAFIESVQLTSVRNDEGKVTLSDIPSIDQFTTDSDGIGISSPLPVGTYVLAETTPPKGKNALTYAPVFSITTSAEADIAAGGDGYYDLGVTLVDDPTYFDVSIVKKDADTTKAVLKAGTVFDIYSVSATGKSKVATAITDADGVATATRLEAGTYEAVEAYAVNGYYNEATNSSAIKVTFTVDNDTPHTRYYKLKDGTLTTSLTLDIDAYARDSTGTILFVDQIEVEYHNPETRGQLEIIKNGDVVAGVSSGSLVYGKQTLAGAVFEVTAKTDIARADNQGKWFKAGDKVATVVTGMDAVTYDDITYIPKTYGSCPYVSVVGNIITLPLGEYTVSEICAPKGYELSTPQNVRLEWDNQTKSVVTVSVTVDNRLKTIYGELEKTNSQTKTPIEGMSFGVYNANDITDLNGTVTLPADTLIETVVTDNAGYAKTSALPYYTVTDTSGNVTDGQYYFLEDKHPAYQENLTKYYFVNDSATPNKVFVENTSIEGSIKIIKFGAENQPLQGVTFQLSNTSGTVLQTLTTNADGAVTFSNLLPNDYIITETNTLNGYQLLAEPIKVTLPFTLTNTEVLTNNVDTSKGIYDDATKMWTFYNLTYQVQDGTVFDIPLTGGMVNPWYAIAGVISVLVGCMGAVVAVVRKRRISF